MLVFAPARQRITHVLGAIALFSACSKSKPAEPDKVERAEAARADAAVADRPAAIAVPAPKLQARTALARRCVLGGDPIPSACVGGGEGIVFGPGGELYAVAGKHVQRYQRAAGDECRFEPSGEPIELPPDNPRPQSLDGPVYMRSGGAAWRLARGATAVYAFDYLGGLFRVDRGKAEPDCDDVFGFGSVAALGKKLYIARKGIEELRLGAKCKAVSAKLDDKARGELYAVRDKLYVASGSRLQRYDGKTPTKLGDGARICHVKGVTACGEGTCVLDSNCMQMIQLGSDGKVLRVLDDDKLFPTRPWTLATTTTAPSGNVYVLAKHRDNANDKQICEAAIYELPAAVFAL